ncbi:hypothetical protein C1752_10451 [Acaryochloris thomasi RCC1774]|uniref:Uncharacterized protein n=1 Tax=Acaryochloris thomasi RCC1774 TaxID=1764569 RepID=A0A2W1JMT6_9CYAN|nr:hypothetical protein [Acaryochloris thomasi]PZD70601.1 hypothetical protein C1752_10451 [Acaryochloris thomasi RCC1774]
MIQVPSVERQIPRYWSSSKPKYPLHVRTVTITGHSGFITGVEQCFSSEGIVWRYQITSIEGSEVIVWDDNGEKVIDIAPDSNRDIYQPSSELVAHLTSFADELEQQEFKREQESEQKVDEGFGIDDD